MAAHKEYSGTLKLGEGTPSLDAELEVNERLPWEHITGVARPNAVRVKALYTDGYNGKMYRRPATYRCAHVQRAVWRHCLMSCCVSSCI